MPIITTVTQYQCEFCLFTFDSEDNAKRHEKTCSKNPIVIEKEKLKSQFYKDIEEIRLTSKTIPEVIQRTVDLFDKNGIDLTFTEYPKKFNDMISSHSDAPLGKPTSRRDTDDKGNPIPKYYPGWTGRWSGTIKYKESDKRLSGSDIYRQSWNCYNDRYPFSIPFMVTGGGNGGTNFSYYGTLWLPDFPIMYKEWQDNNGDFRNLQTEYSEKIQEYIKEYNKAQEVYINDQYDIKENETILKNIEELMTSCKVALMKNKQYYKNQFNEQYDIKIPEMTTAFIDLNEYEKVYQEIKVCKLNKPYNKIPEMLERLHNLLQRYNNYINEHPERFY
jgi:hypothetical protein